MAEDEPATNILGPKRGLDEPIDAQPHKKRKLDEMMQELNSYSADHDIIDHDIIQDIIRLEEYDSDDSSDARDVEALFPIDWNNCFNFDAINAQTQRRASLVESAQIQHSKPVACENNTDDKPIGDAINKGVQKGNEQVQDENDEVSEDKETEKPEVTKKLFMEEADDILEIIECGDDNIVMKKTLFSTGSVGWHGTLHSVKIINNKELNVVFNVKATVVNSRKWKNGGVGAETVNVDKEKSDNIILNDVMTIEEFMKCADKLTFMYGALVLMECKPKKFSSGNVGWTGRANTKRNILNQAHRVVKTLKIIVKGSKDWVKA
eukprot:534842_1